jgi:transcriptional regulator with PAS, ATPase and Fis domain
MGRSRTIWWAGRGTQPSLLLTLTLQEYHWSGNIRELENVLERAVINSSGPKLHLVDDLKKPRKDLKATQKTPHHIKDPKNYGHI